jgi:hypothetical protein
MKLLTFLLISLAMVAALFVAAVGIIGTPNITYNFNSTVITQSGNETVLLGSDGYTYSICDPVYVNSLNLPNTTVYSRTINGARNIYAFQIPEVTFANRVQC